MAKIKAKISIACLVAKDTVGGVRFYWQPSAALKRAGWKSISLGQDMALAIAKSQAENERVGLWRTGGAKPRQVAKYIERATVASLIDAYKKSDKYTNLAETTRSTYSAALNLIEEWATDKTAGDLRASSITRQRVKVLRDALMRPNVDGIVQHHRAHNTLRVLRTLYAFGIDNVEGIDTNPAVSFDLATPAPRDQIWDHEDVDAFCRAAKAIGYPSLAFTVELAEYIGQRESDMLKLHASQYREAKNLDERDRAAIIAEDVRAGVSDGRVMAFFIKQGKTKRWVGIPVGGDIRARIETAFAANAKRAVPSRNLLVDDVQGTPWTNRQFIRKFAEAKARAIDPTGEDLAAGILPRPELEDLQFRDFRRTCVVRLGEMGLEDALVSAITGHKLASMKQIMEVYMPRTMRMAGRAVVARIGHNAQSSMPENTATVEAKA